MTTIPSQRDAIVEAKARSLLDITGRPAYLLTLDQAAELAMFNSRQYQDQREDLYLAALPVTLERFSFMAQFFAGSEAIRSYAGRNAPGGPENNWALNNGIGMSKVLPTGALLLLNFSNQTVFNFLNPKSVTSVSALELHCHPAAAAGRRQGGGPGVADPGRAQPALRDPQLRPLPQGAVRLNRQQQRRRHQRLGLPAQRRPVEQQHRLGRAASAPPA